ncbi:MAG: hypothetical protein J5957_08385 [Prevotella sp.]|nr:hypothetical protein [Prevotella sp.]
MKKIVICCIIIILNASNFVYAQEEASISRIKAWDIIKEQILMRDTSNILVKVSKNIKQPKSIIKSLVKPVISPMYDSWFFFIDDMPKANWEHACRYIFVNTKTGEYEIQKKRRPPLEEMDCLIGLTTNEDYKLKIAPNPIVRTDLMQNPLGLCSVHNYAVIINGGIDKDHNNIRYWNDCSDIYTTLIERYNYPKDHIFVIMSDGTSPNADRLLLNNAYDSSPLDLDGDGQPDIQYAATRDNITSVFNQLGNTLTSEDDLFIFTIDHGGLSDDGNSTLLYLWNHDYITDSEFATEVNKVNAGHIMVCMGQCHSGGFINSLKGNNRVIATACSKQESSWACPDLLHDEFVYHWTSAVRGETASGMIINADTDHDGIVTMYEAFINARDSDCYYTGSINHETPLYSSIISEVGLNTSLYCPFELSIIGNSVVKNSSIYYVKNLPNDGSVVWNIENPNPTVFSFQTNYPDSNQCLITPLSQEAHMSILRAAVVYNNDTIVNFQKDVFFHNATLSGTCDQPFVPGSLQPLTSPIIIYKNMITILSSPNFGGMTCPYLPPISSGSIPSISKYGHYAFHLKLSTNLTIPFVSEDGNTGFVIDFITYARPYSLLTTMDGDNLVVELSNGDDDMVYEQQSGSIIDDTQTEWSVDIFCIDNASVKTKVRPVDRRCVVNTAGWRPGTYVVMATIEGKTVSKKVVIR